MAVTSNIAVGTPASIPTPPAGEATLFINTDDSNILYIKFDTGAYLPYTSDNMADCCSCEISKKYAEDIACALKSGMIDAAQFSTLVNTGFKVIATETNDGNGTKVCTVEMGPQAPQVAPVSLIIIPDVTAKTHPSTQQYYPQFTPINTTNQAVVWVSSNVAAATISQTGLLTTVAAGVTIIYAYSVADGTVVGSKTVTVS
jgi:hypothetical protein